MIRFIFFIVVTIVIMFMMKQTKLHANAFRLMRSGVNTATMSRRGAFSGNHLNMADENV